MPSKMRKRGENSYELTVTNGYDFQGKQIMIRKTIQATSDRDARKQYSQFEAEVRSGAIIKTGKLKLAEFAEQWFRDYCQVKLAPMTLRNYKRYLEKRIIPAIGHLDMVDLKPYHIVPFINSLLTPEKRLDGKSEPVTGQAAAYCYRVLSSMLNTAVKWQVIPSNPCDRVDPPVIKRPHTSAFTEHEALNMLNMLSNEEMKYRMMISLAVTTGLRLGELLGLMWADIDFYRSALQVNRSCQSLAGHGVFTKEPKNESSIRCVTLPNTIMEMFIQYKAWQDQEKIQLSNQWMQSDWVFTTWNGSLLNPSTVSHWFHKFLKRNGLPEIPFHGLRHTSATLLLSEGASLKNVSSRLGHSDIRTTGNIYAHALQSVDKQLAQKMDVFLNKGSDKKE